MPPPAIVEPASLDFSTILADRAEIARVNPQRFEFELLDAVLFVNKETRQFAGYHDIRPDAWWVRAHIPGRPLFPGVLMMEVAAQLSSFMYTRALGNSGFLGFSGVDGVKFRGAVEPPCRLVVVGLCTELKPRRFKSQMQGFVNGTMVFEGQITGMPI